MIVFIADAEMRRKRKFQSITGIYRNRSSLILQIQGQGGRGGHVH